MRRDRRERRGEQGEGEGNGGRNAKGVRKAFTLLEVVLAVAIASGLLLVVMFFYRQMGTLRVAIWQELDGLAAVRVLMDRMSVELGGMHRSEFMDLTMVGSSNSLLFVTTALPETNGWAGADVTEGGGRAGSFDLKLIRYAVSGETNGFGGTGILRREEALLGQIEESESGSGETETTRQVRFGGAGAGQVVTEGVRLLRFRYWDGTNWLSGWTNRLQPLAMEVRMGREPLREGGEGENEAEVFRRVIALPQAQFPAPAVAAEEVLSEGETEGGEI